MYNKLLINFFVFFVSLITFFMLSGDASAAKWPGNQWGDNTEIQIVLSMNQSHQNKSGAYTNFALYSRTSGNKTIIINGYNNENPKCDNKKNTSVTAIVFETANINNLKGFGGDNYNCNSKNLTLSNGEPVSYQKWDNPNETYTYYRYRISAYLPYADRGDAQDNDSKFAFTVDSNDGDFYQLKGEINQNGLPIASNRGNVYLNNIRIPVGSCKVSGGQHFVIYDSDNATDYWAQSRYPDYAGYMPVKFFLNYQIGFANSKLAKESSSVLDWKKVDGDSIYYPDDTPYAPNARPPGSITWDIDQLNNNNKAYFVIKDLGGDNFLNIYVPYDGADAGIGCPPEGNMPSTDEWRLNPSVSINNGSENGVYMSGAHGVQFFYNNGLSGVPGSLGVGNGEGNVNNGNSYVDVNASLKLNGAEQASTNRFYLLDQPNGSSNKTLSYSVPNSPGKYCANMQFPYGEIGRRKTVNEYNGQNGFAEPSKKDHNNAPDGSTPVTNIYDWVRRYRTFYSGNSAYEVQASTYKNVRSVDSNATPTQDQGIWYGFLPNALFGGSNTTYANSNFSNYYWTFWGHMNGSGSINGSTPEKCVYVIKATPNNLSDIPYEKGSGAGISASISIDTGGATPPPTNVGWHLYVTGSGLNISKPVTANTNGTNLSINNVFSAAEQAVINNFAPGTQLDYKVVVDASGEEKSGKITIFEVPFAKFYGNDVYATNGDIKFNSYTNNNSNNPSGNYNGQGTVAQYAALATGTPTIDSAAFRWSFASPFPDPKAPNGLDPSGSYLNNISATRIYNTITQEYMPPNCANYAGGTLPAPSNCYRSNQDISINSSSYSGSITINADNHNVMINGSVDNLESVVYEASTNSAVTLHRHPVGYTESPSYSVNLPVGDYNTQQLAAKGFATSGNPFDIMGLSGISVAQGYMVSMYSGGYFNGARLDLTTDNLNFNSIPAWNNTVRSIRVTRIAPPQVISSGYDGIMLIVADNIYINKAVERLDAILVAKNAIYTCADGTTPVTQANLDNDCRRTLTINGSLSAPTIKFQRVGGSRYLNIGLGDTPDGSFNCHAWKGIKNCGARGDMPLDTGKTAEIINFPAYLYWIKPYLNDNSTPGGETQSLFVAPPRR